MKLDLIVERYVQLRDKKAQMKAAYEASVADITTGMNRLENAILATLNEQGAESFRTAHGTAYKSTSTSVTVADKAVFKEYLMETGQWELAEIRAGKTAIDQFRAANDDLPPGINYSQAVTVGVRRSP
jgi:hypothetical protein